MSKDVFINEDSEEKAQKVFFASFNNKKSLLQTLIGIYKGNYLHLLRSAFFYMFQYSPVVVLPIVTANIINAATYPDQHPISEITLNAVIMAVLFLQNILSNYLSTRDRSTANRSVEMGLRSSMARKLQQLSLTYQKEMKSGRIQSKIMRDVENIEILATNVFTSGVSIILSLVVSISVTLSKNWIVFVFFLITIPAALAIMFAFRTRLKDDNAAFRKEMENTSASVIEMVDLLPVTKAHALEKTALYKFNQHLFRVAGSGFALDKLNGVFGAISWVTFQIFQLICLVFTGVLAYKKIIRIGDITLYQSYFSSIVAQINSIIALLPVFTRGLESVRSVGDIMWALDDEDNKGKKKLTALNGRYEFKNVQFHYKDDPRNVLDGFNLTVEQGETIALVGESGSGKSTLINMVIGFYRPTGGQILIDGNDINDIDLQSYRSFIATVPQDSVLFAGTIRENITYGMEEYSEEDLKKAIRVANLEDVIAKLPDGLDTMVGEHGDKLSGGQKQRIAIARAVIRDARVIIFDEATSALDTVSEKLIQESIDRLASDVTTFVVAHRLSTIRNADKIAVVGNGVCSEYGTYDELMAKKGEFYQFKTLQS